MAVTGIEGFEDQDQDVAPSSAFQSTVVRSGLIACRFGTGSISNVGGTVRGSNVTSFAAYIRIDTYPTAFDWLMQIPDGAFAVYGTPVAILIDNTGVCRLRFGATTIANSAAGAFPIDGAFHLCELACSSNNGATFKIDGTTVVSFLSPGAPGVYTGGTVGTVYGGSSRDLYCDDLMVWDTTLGGGVDAYPSASSGYKIVNLFPISDNARGANWLAGAGGTASLFDAVNNKPPTGAAVATNANEIKNAAKDATGNYDANMTSYTTAGVGASDTVLAVQWKINHAVAATGTQLLGAGQLVSNPAEGAETSFSFGDLDAAGAGSIAGTWPTGWANKRGTILASPTVTKGTSPVMRVGRRNSVKTTAVYADLMTITVAYQPFVAAPSPSMPPLPRHLRADMRHLLRR